MSHATKDIQLPATKTLLTHIRSQAGVAVGPRAGRLASTLIGQRAFGRTTSGGSDAMKSTMKFAPAMKFAMKLALNGTRCAMKCAMKPG
jgi:hypothetical protein